ncbi:exodeoxyribonuclease VII small subunit [Patescibacteria group bacterium]
MVKRKTTKKESINRNMKLLEEIVKKFEKGNVDIDDGIVEYEKAAKLIKEIKRELTSLEVRIEKVQGSY